MKNLIENPETVEATRAARPAPKIHPRKERTSDVAGRESETYWTIKQIEVQPPDGWQVTKYELPPHSKLCVFQYGSLTALVTSLEDRGWNPRDLVNLARVEITGSGFIVDYFPTLADALAAQKALVGKHCCPFCQKSDMLDKPYWCGERFDGSDFEGPAIRCNRCDAIAPLRAWERRRKNQAAVAEKGGAQ